MADLRTEIIDGIKLSNNGIGIVNYETLANLPNLNNYVKKGKRSGQSVTLEPDYKLQVMEN